LYYSRSLQASSREVTLSQGWYLILGLITIIGLDLLPYVVAQAKVENDAPPENYTTLATDSHYVNALTNKALALGRLGNFTGAIEYIDKALAIQPNDTYALIGKGTALGRLGNFTGAILYYDKALAIQPNDTYALTSKGLALDNLGNFTGAILYYDKALAVQPNDTYALDNKAAALDNHTVAIEYIDKALHNNTFLHEVIKSFPGDNIYLHAKVVVNGFDVMADIALTGEQRTKGLDVKNNLTENQGMLFVFQQPYRYGFWMIGMKFPIDIIWLDSNGVVTHMEHSLKPCPPASSNLVCPLYFPEKDSLYVLETVAGFSMKHNLRLGSHVSFELVK
jgi:uncharacterized protein